MTVRSALGLAALALVAWSAQDPDDLEAACTVERLDFYYDAQAEREQGPEARDRLIRRADALLAKWDGRAPKCAGRIREPRAYLLAMDGRDEQIVRDLEPYLADPTTGAEVRTRLLLSGNLYNALIDLGRTRDAMRVAYEAAGYADDAPPVIGMSALLDASRMARYLGDQATSIEYIRAALALATDSTAADLGGDYTVDTVTGQAYVSLGILLRMQVERDGRTAEYDGLVDELEATASEALRRLVSDRKRDFGLRAIALTLRAYARAYRGRIEAAEADLALAERLTEGVGFRAPRALFDVLMARGEVQELADRPDAARRAYERARADALQRADVTNEAQALEHLGELAERVGDLDRAADLYTTAIARYESVRDRLGLDDWSSLAFATTQTPYRGLVRTRLAQGRPAEAFATLDRTRARYLRDLRDHLAIRRRLTPKTRAVIDSLSAELGDLRAAMTGAADAADRSRLRERITTAQARIEEVTAAPRLPLHPLDLPAVQRALGADGRTLVAYFIDRDGSHAFVVDADTLQAVALATTPADVRAALGSVGGPWRDGTADPAFDLSALHRLHELLVAPIAGHVTTDRVVIVPDVEVAAVPFGMLTTAPAQDYADAPYLLREWAIGTELSAALVAEDAAPGDHAVDVLAFGRTAFAGDRSTWNGLDLVHVARELDRVTDYADSEAYLGDTATEARFVARAEAARVLHLASHAEVDPALPLYSRIALSDGDGFDGTLHLYEVLAMPLDADLVVLSGCATALGSERDGEGLVGLQYGMRAAGAAATVATLWSVADDATADLMGAFYDGLADGLGKDEALRRAQLAYLDAHEGLAASPFFWAAPVLSGSPAPVPLRRPVPWLWLAVGAVAVGGLGWGARRLRP